MPTVLIASPILPDELRCNPAVRIIIPSAHDDGLRGVTRARKFL